MCLPMGRRRDSNLRPASRASITFTTPLSLKGFNPYAAGGEFGQYEKVQKT